MKLTFISIDYDEDKKIYESVRLHVGDEKLQFKTGNFVKDWFDCMKHIVINEVEGPVTLSSSVDHFIMDMPFISARLKSDDNGISFYLSYTDFSGMEFFVPEDLKPTWDELKQMCE